MVKKSVVSILLLLLLASSALAEPMLVKATGICYNTNNVGNSWGAMYRFGETKIQDGSVIDITPGEYTVRTKLVEYDISADSGAAETVCTVTEDLVHSGFRVDQMIEVTEDRGTYSGNTAVWYVTFEFIPVTGEKAQILH